MDKKARQKALFSVLAHLEAATNEVLVADKLEAIQDIGLLFQAIAAAHQAIKAELVKAASK